MVRAFIFSSTSSAFLAGTSLLTTSEVPSKDSSLLFCSRLPMRIIFAKVGISASFAIVTIGGKVHISARSDGTVNVAKILEELHGGGHFDSAGAQIEEDANEETIEKLKHAIDKYSSMFEND